MTVIIIDTYYERVGMLAIHNEYSIAECTMTVILSLQIKTYARDHARSK